MSSDYHPELRSLICGNLHKRVTEAMLYEVFLQAGPIEDLAIRADPHNRSRNMGRVTFKHLCTMPFALFLFQDLKLYHNIVAVKPMVDYWNSSLDTSY